MRHLFLLMLLPLVVFADPAVQAVDAGSVTPEVAAAPPIIPSPAVVQVAPAAPSVGSKLTEFALSGNGLALLLGLAVSVIGGVVGANEVRRRRIALGVYYAFHIMEDYSAETETTSDDKIAGALRALDTYMLTNGWRTLKPGEVEMAKMGFTMHNGETKVAEKVAAAAEVKT
jgi:hypothetical protein